MPPLCRASGVKVSQRFLSRRMPKDFRTHIDLLVPPFVELRKAFHARIEPSVSHAFVFYGKALLADVPIGRQALWERQIHVAMAEATLDPLLETLDHVDPRGQA